MDFDAALTATVGRPGQPLKVDVVLAGMDPEQAAKARRALDDRGVGTRHLSRAFAAIGIELSEGAIENWRKANPAPVADEAT